MYRVNGLRTAFDSHRLHQSPKANGSPLAFFSSGGAYRSSCTRAEPLNARPWVFGISVRPLRLAGSGSARRPARPIRVPLASRCA
jgi:hypothetical protein